MNTKGRFYILHNQPAAHSTFWSQPAQNWTKNPRDATFFVDRAEAEAEAKYAGEYGPGEAIVCTATVDLPDVPQSARCA